MEGKYLSGAKSTTPEAPRRELSESEPTINPILNHLKLSRRKEF